MGRVRGGRGGKRHTASKWSPCQLLTCKGSYCTLLSLHVLHWKMESVVIFVSLGYSKDSVQSVQLLSCVRLFPTPQTATSQDSLSITNSRSLLKLMSTESVAPSNHLILCRPLLLPPSVFPSNRVFSNESALRIRWPKYWSFSFNISPSNECSGLTSFRFK